MVEQIPQQNQQMRTVSVKTKRTMNTTTYHLATFDKPISKDVTLPDHIIDNAANIPDD